MQKTMQLGSDRAYDILRSEHQPLDAIFAPKSIAVIGASQREGSVGRTVLWNLISHPFGGTVFPVNPKHHSVLGIKTYPNIAAVPEPVDLAIVITPASTVPGVIGECVDAGVKGAIVLSAGFKEIGTTGAELEQQVLQQVRRGKMRLIGPNCLGVMNPHTGLNATFAHGMALPGKVGFISQSGALCTAILDWSFRENVGFSAFISIGSMLDVGWGDLIYYLGDDPHTESIVIYMESIGDARSFLSAAREVALTKPIIVIKAGRTAAAAKAAASHTGALAGSDAVFDAALRRCGVLRVKSISELFDMAEVLAKQPRPKGPRLTIVTNAGGPGVLATDALITDGGELAELSPETYAALNELLPPQWSHNNPIDILGDADPMRYAKALEIVAKDPNSDGLLVILTPQAMTDPTQSAYKVKSLARIGKPILASWMGDADVEAGAEILNQASIPTFPFPDTAAHVFNYMWRYNYNLRALYETPVLPEGVDTSDRTIAKTIIQTARETGRTLLTEVESKQILAAYGIPTVTTQVATSAAEAVRLAEEIGYPVVLKVYSKTITHKTDVDGVHLNLRDAKAVREAYDAIALSVSTKVGANHFAGVTVQPMVNLKNSYELILGSSIDSQFGPVLLFGTGGQLVEVFQDRALGLPPLNTTLARRMMEQTRIYKALQGVRGRKAVNLEALEQLLVRFSQVVVEQRLIKEIDINPLLVKAEGIDENSLVALDARIVLHDLDITEAQLPKLAIRPYPTQYVSSWTTRNGMQVTIRPIRPEDEPLMIKLHHTLSEESVFFRYFHLIKLSQRIAHERLTRLCFIDYDREMALVVDYENPETGEHEVLAVGRLSKLHGTSEAEFAILVSDRYQCQGLGTELLKRLLEVGRDEQLRLISAEILTENSAMQRVCEKLGFRIYPTVDAAVVRAEIKVAGER
ncbi:bifunctional acetate--CoA ligase family protein/GNAT family N-acetyltransferase [Fischerella thermalis]|uniref:bifunctional acetate--CoA ligase family protein/GNAT family N-acetyltransferase n=1 Tax=Fischerella thermalis TaxID=372787 RepID=UPI000C7FD11B|nr:bifunctional acetate--CoA ligase family protein/GNAT family N-acetyltransferase [Fischerella thermalis]PLZ18863.1 acetyl CoA synthetase subunit alpha [Fischerella thermalis WC1110]PLZ38605.1 acetyl CoA synthetase subunit alpha [Fischerella thermalis WC538]PLZ48798.1 acetyl CoA synthetase subunit alpha [Fischerella thermalis WC527]PLZ55968.1 acetyl CoA synthetase subunit alpha [Fischerella thermalis WC441]PLZ69251.1 acetyl CoA synthetase subunit alpha [Fischerella thermalis WC344]